MTDQIQHNVHQEHRKSFGTGHLSIVDRFGIWLSRRAILGAIKNRTHLEVLELGCGYLAKNLLAIEDRAAKLVGVDFNLSESVSSLPKFLAIETPIMLALEELEGSTFDLIMIISVLEHLDNPVEVLGRCRELLKPDGKLIVNVPTWLGKYFLEFSAFKMGLSPPEEMNDHKMYYDKRDLWPLLVRSGFLPSNIHLRYHKFRLNLFAVATVAEQ